METCALIKVPQPNMQSPHTPFLATRPLEVVAVEYTMLEQARDGRKNYIVMTAYATRNQKAETTNKVILKEWFLKYGVPKCRHSEGRHFLKCRNRRFMQDVWGEENVINAASPPREPTV